MKYLIMFLMSCVLAFGATHKLIVKFDTPQDPTLALTGYNILSWRQLGDRPVYRLKIDSSLSKSDLMDSIYQQLNVAVVEENQPSASVTLEAAGSVDSRVIFIIDEILEEGIYTSASGEVNSRVIFIIDQAQTEFEALYSQYHATHVRAHLAWDYTSGAGQTVAIIDTGVDINHPFLVDNIVQGYDFVDNDDIADEVRADLDTNDNGLLDEGYGHGTHVAGIVKTIAPGVSIMPIRVADSDGQAELDQLIEGIDYAISHGADVINLSMSIPEPSDLLIEAIENARQAGIVVVTSAGNNDSSNLMYPSTESEVITVASVDLNYQRSSFSNYGRKIDVSAPGERIISAYPGGGYVARSGTSMAAPIVSAEAAIIFELVPTGSVQYVRGRIKNKTRNINQLNNKDVGGFADIWDAITIQNQN